jgi:CBS-domain-containing membrane protein
MYEFLQETVANNMTTAVRSITPQTTVGDLYRFFAADDFDAYPVVQDGVLVGRNLIGIIARQDVMRAMERWTLRQ